MPLTITEFTNFISIQGFGPSLKPKRKLFNNYNKLNEKQELVAKWIVKSFLLGLDFTGQPITLKLAGNDTPQTWVGVFWSVATRVLMLGIF